jgi:Ino eighty subunit 2
MSRPRRIAGVPSATASANQSSTVGVSRSPSHSPEDRPKNFKLTIKMPSSKLREVTTPSTVGRSIAVNSRDTFEAGEIMTGKRSTRRKHYTEGADSDTPEGSEEEDEDEDEAEEEDEDEDVIAMDVRFNEPCGNADVTLTSDEESEDEDEQSLEEDGDEKATVGSSKQTPSHPPPKVAAKMESKAPGKVAGNPALVVTATTDPIRSVEGNKPQVKHNNDEDDDEELSELESEEEVEVEADGNTIDIDDEEDGLGAEEDAEGDEDMDAEGELVSDDETPGSGSGTPVPQTKRQRGQDDGAFLALPMEPQIKKVLTADEHRMRRAEMARRRKNLSEKRNEEEKVRCDQIVMLLPTTSSLTLVSPDVNHQSTSQTTGAQAQRQGHEPRDTGGSRGSRRSVVRRTRGSRGRKGQSILCALAQ